MAPSKEIMGKKFEEMRELLRPEAEIHKAAICMTELLSMFFDYIDERRESFEQHMENVRINSGNS